MSGLAASQRLMTLVFQSQEEGLEMLQKQGAFVPFAYFLTKEGYILRRFSGVSTTESLQNAYQIIRQSDEDMLAYALVYDAVITLDEQEYDALMIEAGERDTKQGLRFVQRYHSPATDSLPITIGELAYLGLCDRLF